MLILNWIFFVWFGLVIVFEVVVNLLLKYFDGFCRCGFGIVLIFCVMVVFIVLVQVVKDIELLFVYVIWGGFGIFVIVVMGWVLFGQCLVWCGWFGLLLLLVGMSLFKLV